MGLQLSSGMYTTLPEHMTEKATAIDKSAVYVEREDDRAPFLAKAFDFSGSTITDLFEKGIAAGNKAYERSRLP